MSIYRKYMQQGALTNDPVKNTILLYERIIKELNVIKVLFGDFKFREAENHVEKVEQIINGLIAQLNEDADEELAIDFVRLYAWMLDEVYEIKQFRKSEGIPALIKVVSDLVEAFNGAMKIEDEKAGNE